MEGNKDFEQQPEFEKHRVDIGNEQKSVMIPVIEEKLQMDKIAVETGKVLISKHVHQEEVAVDIPIIDEEVDVERIEINQYIETPPPAVRYEGETMIIPILREVVVVEKRLMLVEEVRVTKRQMHRQETQQVVLRKEEVVVDRVAKTDLNPDSV